MMKKKDVIVIGILLLVIGVGYLIFQHMQGEMKTIDIYYNKDVIKQVSIDKDTVYEFEGDYGKFCLEVKDKKYRAIHVECPNHDCEKVGWVEKGSTKQIVCVPNNIYIIQSDGVDTY